MKTFLSPLSAQEEKRYLEQFREGDIEAKHILVEHNMRLVAHVAKKYQNIDEDMEDMISIGTIGLIKAIDTFRADRGSKLATYAARCIDNELLMYLRSKRKSSREISLYDPIGTDKEGNQIHLLDVMEQEEPDVIERMEFDKNVRRLYDLMPRVLNDRERMILCLRYGLRSQRPVTQREIARRLDISRSYVSRIEKKALQKLRKEFREEK
ncbi:MAG: RNA polymerase sporulation sigma factor SigK [Lachnospiraceae bacterium]|nr:RNA polymerase sporulation sigma factor SigK [Lachnospiraceae bacterium]